MTRDLLYDKATSKQFITMQGWRQRSYINHYYDAPVVRKKNNTPPIFTNQRVDEADCRALEIGPALL